MVRLLVKQDVEVEVVNVVSGQEFLFMHCFVFVLHLRDVFDFYEWVVSGQLTLCGRGLQQILAHACFQLRVAGVFPLAIDFEQLAILDLLVLDLHYFLLIFNRVLFLLFHFDVISFMPSALRLFCFGFECFIVLDQFLRGHNLPWQVIDLGVFSDLNLHHLFDEIAILFGVDCAAIVQDVIGEQLRVQYSREINHVKWLVHENTLLVLVRGQILFQG